IRPCLSLWYRQTALRYTRLSIRPLEGDHQVGHVRPGRAGVDEIAARLQKTTCIGATQVINHIDPLERSSREKTTKKKQTKKPNKTNTTNQTHNKKADTVVTSEHGRRGEC